MDSSGFFGSLGLAATPRPMTACRRTEPSGDEDHFVTSGASSRNLAV
jgi:hypothetical protein